MPSRSTQLLDAVVTLTPRGKRAPTPAQTRQLAKSVLSHVASSTGIEPESSNVFEHLHSFSVRAPRPFLDALARTEGVARVVPNEMKDSALIKPVKRAPVKLPR
jgi:hypothetical protein